MMLPFQLTRPMRGVTFVAAKLHDYFTFQLTRPMRGVTRSGEEIAADVIISTHTPHAGRDTAKKVI